MEHILDTRNDIDDEPVGIVISGGSLPEPAPRLWAYVWGQDDEHGIPAGLTTAA